MEVCYTAAEILNAARSVRKQVLRLALDRGGCYLGQACSSAEILSTLYMRVLNLGKSRGSPEAALFPGVPGPGNMNYPKGSLYNGPALAEYDRFFLSPAHYAVVLYCVLAECGRISRSAVGQFNSDGWNMEMIGAEHSPGFETTAGSLGQTISIAAGTAHARKIKGDSGRVFIFLSDGEIQEGQVWECFQAASFYHLDNIVIYVDVNGHQLEGLTKNVMNIEPLAKRLEAFGTAAVEIDGHDVEALSAAVNTPHEGKPLAVLCQTSCTRDIPFLERREPYLHFIKFEKDELAEAEAFYAKM
jgi:transketolase